VEGIYVDAPGDYCGEVKAWAMQKPGEIPQKIDVLERLKVVLSEMMGAM